MPDDSVLGKRQADSSGWDTDQDRKRVCCDQDPRVKPPLQDLFGSPPAWPTTVHSAIDPFSDLNFGDNSEYPGLSDEPQKNWDMDSILCDEYYSNQLVKSDPAFQNNFISPLNEPPFTYSPSTSHEDHMQYSLINDATSINLNTSSFQPIGMQHGLIQSSDGLERQTIPTASKGALAVHDDQTLVAPYCSSTPVVTEHKTAIDTCFGVIITTPTCSTIGKESKPSVAVRLDNCGTFSKLHNEVTNEYLGLLNIPALCKLLSFSSTRLKAHLSPNEVLAPPGKPRKRKGAAPEPPTEYNLRIVVEGSKKDGKDVGRLLSDAELFLQHPSASERDPTLEYFNPQFLLRPGEGMPALEDLVIEDDGQELRSKQLDDITKARLLRVFDNANANDTPGNAEFDITPSSRLRTTLMPHQLKALGMMLGRESGVIGSEQFPSLWVRDQNEPNRLLYRHRITGLSSPNPDIMSGGVIADDMGLGKSLSLLALICSSLDHCEKTEPKEQASASTLIIAPKSVISAWQTQLKRHIHAGRVKMLLYHGASRSQGCSAFGDFDIVLTTYDTLRSEFTLQGPLYSHAWLRLALDEAHRIRNRDSQTFQACCKIQATYRWCLTGTPIQNALDDYGSLLSFLRIGPFQDKREFDRWIAKPFYKGDKQSLDTLRCLIISTCFRRTKATVNLSNPLPAREDIVHNVTLLPGDQTMYDFFKKIIQDKVTGTTTNKPGTLGQDNNHVDILAYITTLRRICDHSQLLSQRAIDTWRQGDSEDADNTLILTPTTNCDVCGEEYEDSMSPSGSPGPCKACFSKEDTRSAINASNDPIQNQSPTSAKIEALLGNLQQHKTGFQGQRCPKSVVFTAWTKMLDLVERALQTRGFNCRRIDGQTSLQGRSSAIEVFNEDDSCTVMLATIGSAGEGVDFTAAQYVHLLEPHWNPMAEAQAVDRVHRIGQTKPVTVIRYIVPTSIESYIQWVQQDKMRTINMSLDTISDADKEEKRRWERLKKYLK